MAGALGVVITTDVPMSGQHAQPVYVDDSLPIVGPSRAIVVTAGEVPQMGGPPLAVRLAPAGTPVLGPALPVYVVPGGGSLGGAASLVYQFLDMFTTNRAAGSVNGTAAEPGPGNRVVTDGANVISIANDRLTINGTPSGGSDGYGAPSTFARVAGRAAIFNIANMTATGFGRLGWATTLGSGIVGGIAWSSTPTTLQVRNGVEVFSTVTIPAMPAPIWVILRGTGCFVAVGRKLIGVLNTTNTSNIKPIVWTPNAQSNIESFLDIGVTDLTGSWTTDYGIATSRSATPISGATGTMTPDGHVEFTWTVLTGETLELDVRRTDANNRWCVRCSQAGSTIKLIQIQAGVETERSSAAQTWTNGSTYRLYVICDTATITTYVVGTAKNAYSSASFNQTATGVAVAGHATGTDLVAWPIDLSALLPNIASYSNRYFYVVGDSKSTGATWVTPFTYRASDAATGIWAEAGTRVAASGRSVHTTKAAIDAGLAAVAATPAPEVVLIDLGVNDVNGDSADVDVLTPAVWQSEYLYTIDAVHTKWASAQIYLTLPGKRGDATQDDKLDRIRTIYIPAVVAARASFVHTGDNESVYLEGGDDYTTWTSDGIHPTTAGYDLAAAQKKAAIGI